MQIRIIYIGLLLLLILYLFSYNWFGQKKVFAPDNRFVEMESMSAEQTLKPGGEIHWVEKWLLTDGTIDTKDVSVILKCLD